MSQEGKKNLVSASIANVRFLVDDVIRQEEIPARADKPARTLFKQAMVVIGGSRTLNTDVSGFERGSMLSSGVYVASNTCLKLNTYGRLELDMGFRNENFIRVRDMNADEKNHFVATATNIKDLVG